MATNARPGRETRIPLWRERVLRAGLAYADEEGLDAFSMRKLAQALEVAPMALYRHVTSKDDLVGGIIDLVFAEIALPDDQVDWKTAMRQRAIAVRQALLSHPWAIGLMESRLEPGPANLRHRDALIGRLLRAGFSVAMAAHAYSLMDSYIYGFALQQKNLPFRGSGDPIEVGQGVLDEAPASDYPHLAAIEHVMTPGGDGAEFLFGLDLILDGLERVLATAG